MAKSPFLNSIREFMLVRHYSLRTINTYIYWIHQYIIFHHKQHPRKLSSRDVEEFLTHLSVNRHVASATQALA